MKKIFTLVFLLASVLTLWAATNEITYKTSDDVQLVMGVTGGFGANISGHTYAGGVGTITFDGDVTAIPNSAFTACETLVSIDLPSSVTSIGNDAFAGTSLESLVIPEAVDVIKGHAFGSCLDLKSVVMPSSVTSLGAMLFSGCSSLTTINLPENLTAIPSQMFGGCTSLVSIKIPASVASLGANALSGCTGLAMIEVMREVPATVGSNAFKNVPDVPVYVPCGCVEAYQKAAGWSKFKKTISEPNPRYVLSLSVENPDMGSVTVVKDNLCGSEFYAQSNYGYSFDKWSDGEADSVRSMVLTEALTLVAKFKKNQYTITTKSEDLAKGYTYGDTTAYYLDVVTIGAEAEFGCKFSRWNDWNKDNPRHIQVTKNQEFEANFVKKTVRTQTIEVEVCDSTEYIDPYTGDTIFVVAADPTTLTWKDSVRTADVDYIYTIQVTPLLKPAMLTKAELESLGAVPVLRAGEMPVTDASVKAILKHYSKQAANIAKVVNVSWVSLKVECGVASHQMALVVEDACGDVMTQTFEFAVESNTVTNYETAEACNSYYWRQTKETYTKPGVNTYRDTIFTQAGCDSIYYELKLTIWESDTTEIDTTVCYGAVLDGVKMYTNQTVTKTYINQHDCDSVVIWSLKVLPEVPVTLDSAVICFGDSYTWQGKVFTENTETSVILEDKNGCDSVVALKLTVLPPVQKTVYKDTVCYGKSYIWSEKVGSSYKGTCKDSIVLHDIHGCDSVIVLELTELPEIKEQHVYDTICFGDTATWNGKQYTVSCSDQYTFTSQYGCDSVVNYYLFVRPEVKENITNATICYGERFVWQGEVYTQSIDTSLALKNAFGCDSVVSLHLVVRPEQAVTTINDTICFGETYTWSANGKTYAENTYKESVVLTNQYGCDSVVVLNLTIREAHKPSIKVDTVCFGETYTWNISGKTYKESCNDTVVLTDQYGCDSVAILQLTVMPEVPETIVKDTVCYGETYQWIVDGQTYKGNTTATAVLKNQYGCDSVVILHLTELPKIEDTFVRDTICDGEEYTWEGQTFRKSIKATMILTSQFGCDSVVGFELVVLPKIKTTIVKDTICEGDTYVWSANGKAYTKAANEVDTLTSIHGCDSVVNLQLTVMPAVPVTVINDTICAGETYVWSANGREFTVSAENQLDTLTSIHGCDSVVVLNLHVRPAHRPTVVVDTICFGETYTWSANEKAYTETCQDTAILNDQYGCDSVVILQLLELPEILPVVTVDTICAGEEYAWQGSVYTQSIDTALSLQSVYGCDSVVELHLYVRPEVAETIIYDTICAGEDYVWSANGVTYVDNAYDQTVVLKNVHGCDSVVTLNLTVRAANKPSVLLDTICYGGTYTWGVSGKQYTASCRDTVLLQDQYGCDSLAVLHLTVLPEVKETLVKDSVCFGEDYVWEVNGATYRGTTRASVTLTDKYGCDSVVTLELTELPEIDPVVTKDTICAGEEYAWQGAVYAQSIDTALTLRSVYGCDSVVELHLYVRPQVAETIINDTICAGEKYVWSANGKTYVENAYDQTVVLNDVNGCDSVVTLNLTVRAANKPSVLLDTICYGGTYTWGVSGKQYTASCRDTVLLQDQYGCDSLAVLHLTVLPEVKETLVKDSVCFGEDYVWEVNGATYRGTTRASVTLTDKYGCDSVVTLELTELPEIDPVVTKDTICAGEPYSWRGKAYGATGIYNDTVVTKYGCDSIYTLKLHVWPTVAPQVVRDTICHGESYEFGEAIYTESVTTTYTFNDIHGCDSVVTLMLYVWPENRDSITVTEYLCHGVGSFLWDVNNVVYTKDTLAKAVLQDVNGCDSVVFLNLVSVPLLTDTVVETICYGESYDWFGSTYTTTGTYDHKLTSVVTGCDSIAVLNLTVLDKIEPEVTNGATCAGVAYKWRGKAYTAAGTYTESVKTTNGCDSVFVLNLHVWPAVVPTEVYDTICAGETYTYNGETYTQSIVTDVKLTSVHGCDSIVRLNLHFLPENKDSITVTEYLCYGETSYVWPVTNEAYSTDTLVRGVLQDVNGCDSVVFLNLVSVPLLTDTVVETICYGESYDWFGDIYNTTGIYDHTLTSVVNGCDSIAVLNLTVLPEILETVIHDTIYQGDKYNWEGVEYTDTDDYTRTFPSIHGCDSVVTLKLYVRPLIELVTTDTICAGDSYTWNEFVYTSTTDTIIQIARDTTLRLNLTVLSPIPDTVYNVSICAGEEYTWFGVKYNTTTYRRDTLPSVHGCDSVSVLNLTVWPKLAPITFLDTICHGETYEWEGDVYNDSVMVTKTLTDMHGCDSIVTLKLAVLPPVPSTEETVVACDTYTWHEKEYTMTGDYVDTIPSATGCDSIVTLHLTINYSAIKHLYDTVCDTYTWYTGDVFTKTGIYYDTLATEQGCDSVVALHLTVNHRIETEETIAICYGTTLTWNGVVYDATGDYQFDTLTVHGCDSIVTLHLTVLPEMRVDSTTLAVCPSELPYKWGGQTLTAAGEYTYLEQFAANNTCDSVLHVLTFEVLPETSSDTTVVACDSYTWNGKTYTQSGDYSFTTTGANGCDSTAHLHLTVNYSIATHDYQTICYGQTYNWNHTIYDATGDYIDTLSSVLTGCDSIVTLHLTILPEVVNITEEEVICPRELPYNFWRGYSLTESGLYYDTVPNSLGCDSIIYALKLKVLPADTTKLVIAACDSFTWDGTGQTYDRSGKWVYQTLGSDGCDSVIILDLTITNTIYKDTSVTECVSYEWDGHLYTESGDYTKTYSAVNHCDSIVTLHLTILKPSTGSEDVYICNGETYTWEGDVYDTSGEYVKTLTNAAGCDSTAHLHLTVLPEMTYKYHTLYVCAGDLPYEWNNLSLIESGEYTYREQFAANASCDSIEHVLTFTVYDMSLPDTISQPIAICGKPIDIMKATDQIESYIASIAHYAPNATVVWQEWIDGVWVDYDYETLKGSQSEIIIRYAIITDCGVIYSDEMVLVVEQATPENSTELDNMSVESKYGNRIFLFDLNAFSSTFGWTPTPEQVSWYKVVGEVDVYGEMGDDELVGVGHSYNLPEGEVMVGGYYAIVEQHAVSVDDCETIYRSTVIYATASGIAPKLVPNVVYPDEVLTIKNLDESQIHQILVYGASGELIATYKADKVGEFMFNAANATGYYLVDIINTNGSTTLRYVVK